MFLLRLIEWHELLDHHRSRSLNDNRASSRRLLERIALVRFAFQLDVLMAGKGEPLSGAKVKSREEHHESRCNLYQLHQLSTPIFKIDLTGASITNDPQTVVHVLGGHRSLRIASANPLAGLHLAALVPFAVYLHSTAIAVNHASRKLCTKISRNNRPFYAKD